MMEWNSDLARLLLTPALAAAVVVLLTPFIILVSRKQGWVAEPRADRWHEAPTALMGGVAILAAILAAEAMSGGTSLSAWVWAGAGLLFATGLADDLMDLRPGTKLLAQGLSATMLMASGHFLGAGWPTWLSVPLTLLWVVGITNAVNLLDNMDGLAAGVVSIAALALAALALQWGSFAVCKTTLAVAGATAAFLLFNFNPARIFMGDCGSTVLGYLIAASCLVLPGKASVTGFGLTVPAVAALVMAVPIFDTVLVTLVRRLSGRAITQGGRDHSSHRLVSLGLSERGAVLSLYAVSAVAAGVALACRTVAPQLLLAPFLFVVVGLAVLGVVLSGAEVYQRSKPVFAPPRFAQALALLADSALVVAAFIAAYHLRFEAGISLEQLDLVMAAIPVILVIKIPILVLMGAYRRLWRQAGSWEVLSLARGTTLASAATYVALGTWMGFEKMSRGVVVIDWMIVTISVAGVRVALSELPRYLSAARRTGERVLIIGAGHHGALALDELRRNDSRRSVPVGFLDQDRGLLGRSLRGVPILGTTEDLEHTCEALRVGELLLTGLAPETDECRDLARRASELGVGCRTFTCCVEEVNLPIERSGRLEPAFVTPREGRRQRASG